ncbi:hypothetical protein BDI_3875 [Parabacteroides distasonis ATCC 8503]|uniref:Uncharacterized protein n=1 Tax=Parabacteroides distasonis (strain ATCC 8503 / DSM 20701 / CIP 104284 / JCM 5825 / NCTC 11152) TaxID=435591 RepID=A6LIP2_PARD8|nr:hypothetical protein BDI_3875 [Parabacteroides distasonis ATCC 8503]EFI07843.1 conserved hypothetical protein [Bacteroides sp. 3_1_19]
MRSFLLVQFDLTGNHVAELLSVLLLTSEIGNHVPEILLEAAGPFFVTVTSIDLSERFLEKCVSQPFIPMVVVLPERDKQQPVIIQCFHICSFLSKTSAYMGRHFYFLMSFQSVFRGLRQGLAKENTAAKRG